MSLVPIVALGFILARVLQRQIITRTLADAGESAQLVARLGIQPRLTPSDLRNGLSARGIRELDEQLRARSVHARSGAHQDLEQPAARSSIPTTTA